MRHAATGLRMQLGLLRSTVQRRAGQYHEDQTHMLGSASLQKHYFLQQQLSRKQRHSLSNRMNNLKGYTSRRGHMPAPSMTRMTGIRGDSGRRTAQRGQSMQVSGKGNACNVAGFDDRERRSNSGLTSQAEGEQINGPLRKLLLRRECWSRNHEQTGAAARWAEARSVAPITDKRTRQKLDGKERSGGECNASHEVRRAIRAL